MRYKETNYELKMVFLLMLVTASLHFFNSLFIHSLILHIVFTNSCNNLPTQPYSTQNISLTFTHPISTILTSLPPLLPPLTQQNKQKQIKKKKNEIKKLHKRG